MTDPRVRRVLDHYRHLRDSLPPQEDDPGAGEELLREDEFWKSFRARANEQLGEP